MGQKVGYARVSSRAQNLDSQYDQLNAYGCERIFVDEYTGKTTRSRTKLNAMLDYLREGDTVVVAKLDRLSRSLMDLLSLSEKIRDKGAELKSLSENLDTKNGPGKLVFNVMATLAEYEREIIRERTMEGLAAARKRGRIGGRPPVLNQRQRDLVLRMRADGDSLREIARTLNVSPGTVHRVVKLSKQQDADEQAARPSPSEL